MSRRATIAAGLRLARWLGPWAGDRVPSGVARRTVALTPAAARAADPGASFRAYLYEPPVAATGAVLVAPGLHFAGPDDPRLDRFCRILAASGHVVLCPFLPSFTALLVEPHAADDLIAAFDVLEAEAVVRRLPAPAILSISFGSLPTAVLAARASHRRRLGGWISFGGYRDFAATIRFALTGRLRGERGEVELPRDPLNAPVVILNVLPFLGSELGDGVDRARLAGALREAAHRTWGRQELKRPGARDPIIHAIAAALPERERDLVLVACGLRPGAAELLEIGLARAGDAFEFADPGPHLRQIEAPVAVVHGRDDDVIPWLEAEKLAAALPPGRGRLHLTGLFGHTGSARPRAGDVAREVLTLAQILRDLAAAPRGGARKV